MYFCPLPLKIVTTSEKRYLQDAGCPTHFSEIGVNRKLAYQAIMNARYIRGRLTVLDIAGELDILEEIASVVVD